MGEKRSRSSTKAWASLRPKHSSIKFPACCAAFTLDHGNPDWPPRDMMGLVVGDVPFHDLKNPTERLPGTQPFCEFADVFVIAYYNSGCQDFSYQHQAQLFPHRSVSIAEEKKNVRLKARPWLPATGINVQISAHRSNLIWSHQSHQYIVKYCLKEKTHPSIHDFHNNIDNLMLSAACHHLHPFMESHHMPSGCFIQIAAKVRFIQRHGVYGRTIPVRGNMALTVSSSM